MRHFCHLLAALLAFGSAASIWGPRPARAEAPPTEAPPNEAPPLTEAAAGRLLGKYCLRCHGPDKREAGVRLDGVRGRAAMLAQRKLWGAAAELVRAEEMPTEAPLPTPPERIALAAWIESQIEIDWTQWKDPGRVTIPRLTRDEYSNTLRDLLGVELSLDELLSPDGEGESGFNNDRDSLAFTPALLEKYWDAAERAIDSVAAVEAGPITIRLESEKMFMTETREQPQQIGESFFGYVLNRGQMTLYDSVRFPFDGVYEFTVRAVSTAGPTGARLRINDRAAGDILAPDQTPREYKFTHYVTRGSHQLAWNIERPAAPRGKPAAAPQQQEQKQEQKQQEQEQVQVQQQEQQAQREQQEQGEYTKLPRNANQLVDRRAPERAPRWKGPVSDELKPLVQRLNSNALGVQRPYEWLRLHGPRGAPDQIARFKGYIAERTPGFEKAANELAAALNMTRAEWDRAFAAANSETLEDRRAVLAAVASVAAPKPRKRKAGKAAAPSNKPGNIGIDWFQIRGPLRREGAPPPPLSLAYHGAPGDAEAAARETLAGFARRAFRRPLQKGEIDPYVELFRGAAGRGDPHHEALKLPLTAILVSPHFLYRVELGESDGEFPLNDHQIASRLSYFLWLSMPDQELSRLADNGKLRDEQLLRRQTQRMLADPKAAEFLRVFAGQWLGYAALGDSVLPDEQKFPGFTESLAASMKQETALLLTDVVRNDRSLDQLLVADYTYLNEELARHYGIAGVRGPQMRRVPLLERGGGPAAGRGGLLGMGSVLTATSSPTRTSPVSRGKWVLETLLGETLPEPPADAGELPGDAGEARTLRAELLQHRRNPSCASCHDKIDPIGFGLESFDAVGRFRDSMAGQPIDTSGQLPDGTRFSGADELKQILLRTRREDFAEQVTRKLLGFALGRRLQLYDEVAISKMLARLKPAGYPAGGLIEEIVLSYPFRNQNNRAAPTASEN